MKVYVSRGRTVVTGQRADGSRKEHGPGELVDIDPAEVEFLKARGFVQDVPPTLYAPAEHNPAGIGLQNGNLQGPQFKR